MALLNDIPLSENLALPESAVGYPQAADVLIKQYESVTFEQAHRTVLHYLALPAGRVADLGAGSGRDASALAERGHEVFAVEPVPEFRAAAQRLHPNPEINWVDDALPELDQLTGEFSLVMATAVWMHLDEAERARGVRRVARLLRPGGRWVLTLRHDRAPKPVAPKPGAPKTRAPIARVPESRRMFDVAPVEVISAAADCGLELAHFSHCADAHGRRGVSWTNLVLECP